ncbi:MAG: hypothetical protein V1833_03705 [Elusimicrobiota bacterium]
MNNLNDSSRYLSIGYYCYIILFILISVRLYAAGLSTNYADVFIENLSINTEYNLRISRGLPLKVTNKSKKNMDIVIDVQIPQKDNLKPNAKPLPTEKWVTILPQKYTVLPGETGISDVIIKIPKDKKLREKIFQFNLEICGYPSGKKGGISIVPSLLSRVRFSIEKKKKRFLFW